MLFLLQKFPIPLSKFLIIVYVEHLVVMGGQSYGGNIECLKTSCVSHKSLQPQREIFDQDNYIHNCGSDAIPRAP